MTDQPPPTQAYERLGAFYLGRTWDPGTGKPTDEPILYDARDLTTHAMCVGMTGSGKTGLCVALLEEAAIDGIPAICIDPKGDLGNLMLTFPELRPGDFREWVDPGEAQRKGMTVDEYAADRAGLWKKGLAGWGQDGDRIRRLKDAAEFTIFTPGSTAGTPISVLRSFAAPPPALLDDAELLRDRVSGAVSGLLALLGIEADPIRSREHILLSNIIQHAWSEGRDLDLAGLIIAVQQPAFERIGVMDLESFFPAKDRFALAMSMNGILASPGFATWMEGVPLDIQSLLYTPDGRPRVSILSIAHLSDPERMFFVTLLLNEVIAWMRSQSGTTSLRALLYMDEVFGFLPPVANPPSKIPMLTLLKQARAFGLGLVLATQNPADLDYKALSNMGTWFLGRLQTERDQNRVLDGLEGASSASGATFNRARLEEILSGLGSRVFLMNNVHEDEPVLFHTRWVMSYLRGPLTRDQIRRLSAEHPPAVAAASATPAPARTAPAVATGADAGADDGYAGAPTPVPPGVRNGFLPITSAVPTGKRLVYVPALVARGRLHYVRASAKLDHWVETALFAALDDGATDDPWEAADPVPAEALELEKKPDSRGRFAALPIEAGRTTSHKKWQRAFVDHLYRQREMTIWHCKALKEYSGPDEDEGMFRVRLREKLHERRDLAVEKLRSRYGPKVYQLQERIRKAEQAVEKERAQLKQQKVSTAISFGATVLGALFGRKAKSVGTVSRAGTAIRGAGRVSREKGDIARAEENVESLQQRLADLEREFEQEIEGTEELGDPNAVELDAITVRPRKSEIDVRTFALAWAPYRVAPDGTMDPAFETASG